jgi:hypothetical protein
MKRYWALSPVEVRRTVIVGLIAIALVVPLQLLVLYKITTRLIQQLNSFDPFAVINGSSKIIAPEPWENFIVGFSASGAATLGTLAIMTSIRFVTPYRSNAMKIVLICGVGHVLFIIATIIGAISGNRSWDEKVFGTIASLIWILPTIILTLNPKVRAWCAPLKLPIPEIKDRVKK